MVNHAHDVQIKLTTGLIMAVTVLFQLLDKKGILSKDDAIAALREGHDEMMSSELKDAPNIQAQTAAFRLLMHGLSEQSDETDDQALKDWLLLGPRTRDS